LHGSANELLRLQAGFARDLGILAKCIANIQHLYSNDTTTTIGAAKMTAAGPNKRLIATMPRSMTAGGTSTRRLWINGVNKLPSI
jgi:hypothetical protein